MRFPDLTGNSVFKLRKYLKCTATFHLHNKSRQRLEMFTLVESRMHSYIESFIHVLTKYININIYIYGVSKKKCPSNKVQPSQKGSFFLGHLVNSYQPSIFLIVIQLSNSKWSYIQDRDVDKSHNSLCVCKLMGIVICDLPWCPSQHCTNGKKKTTKRCSFELLLTCWHWIFTSVIIITYNITKYFQIFRQQCHSASFASHHNSPLLIQLSKYLFIMVWSRYGQTVYSGNSKKYHLEWGIK